ncbi:MAG TPA: class II aldolase/adducin family protein [Anaerolineae bacterium]|jgi:ribulose-5-phosphate 4-epimerase/fuculose-1-phosphate aldolase
MTTKEGIVKYSLDYVKGAAIDARVIRPLNAWRHILYMVNLIGQDPQRYGGAGFGNVSVRLEVPIKDTQPRFAISGTQTGGTPDLTVQQYAIVTETWPNENRVVATGPITPSSESLTHGILYQLDTSVRAIFHAHSPAIWSHSRQLEIPSTGSDAAYGTPEMADEVRRLMQSYAAHERRILCMGGHTDGVITMGRTVDEAGCVMMTVLAKALALKSTVGLCLQSRVMLEGRDGNA